MFNLFVLLYIYIYHVILIDTAVAIMIAQKTQMRNVVNDQQDVARL